MDMVIVWNQDVFVVVLEGISIGSFKTVENLRPIIKTFLLSNYGKSNVETFGRIDDKTYQRLKTMIEELEALALTVQTQGRLEVF